MSQEHNTLPWPGLEPGLSNSEPSALTTGLLNKAVALACLRYSWPRKLKVAPCTVVWLYIQIFSAWWVTTSLYNYGAMLRSSTIKFIQIHLTLYTLKSVCIFSVLLFKSKASFIGDHFLYSHNVNVRLGSDIVGRNLMLVPPRV